jgi:hypothetical protein
MGSLLTVIEEWYTGDVERETVYKESPVLVLRWINEAQLRYCNHSEALQGTWSPTVPSNGIIALPADFLREYQNRVKWDESTMLRNLPYEDALNISSFNGVSFYSIYGGNFYVFEACAGSPTIPYIKKPAVVTTLLYKTATLEIPTEDQNLLHIFLDAMMLKKAKDHSGSLKLLEFFDSKSNQAGSKFRTRRDPPRTTISRRF